MAFETRAVMKVRWRVGEDLADQLTDRLMATNRYIVMERSQINALLKTAYRGDSGRDKKKEVYNYNQLKYLVKGTITDFTVTNPTDGGVGKFLKGGDLFDHSPKAIVAVNLYVVDVESGQILASEQLNTTVKANENPPTVYTDMAFGSYTFYKTPLGEATKEILDEALVRIARSIDEISFQPKIASIINGQIILNGGKDRQIKVGTKYLVRPKSERIADPDTGEVLGHVTGEPVGVVRVTQVTEKYAICEVVNGSGFSVGQTLFPHHGSGNPPPTARTSY